MLLMTNAFSETVPSLCQASRRNRLPHTLSLLLCGMMPVPGGPQHGQSVVGRTKQHLGSEDVSVQKDGRISWPGRWKESTTHCTHFSDQWHYERSFFWVYYECFFKVHWSSCPFMTSLSLGIDLWPTSATTRGGSPRWPLLQWSPWNVWQFISLPCDWDLSSTFEGGNQHLVLHRTSLNPLSSRS